MSSLSSTDESEFQGLTSNRASHNHHHHHHPRHKAVNPDADNQFDMDNDGHSDFAYLRNSITKRRPSETTYNVHSYQNGSHISKKYELINLPTEILLQIFNHLDRRDLFQLLTVCREFADLIIEILWFRPNMQKDVSFKRIQNIMEQPASTTFWDYRLFIKRLNLSFMTKLVDDHLLSLFIGCPKLERLTLVNCTKLTHEPITATLKSCERLQSIDLSGVSDIQDDIFIELAENCTRLQGLYAPKCGNVSESAIIKLLESCHMLKRVKFNNSENITDETILAMHENCKSLVEIDLHGCPNVTDKYLKLIFKNMTQLREFRISKAPKVTDKLLELIPEDYCLEKLRIVDISDCNAITDQLVDNLVRVAPKLRNVVLSKCMQITDASLRSLAQLGRSLHYIHLGHCSLITDFGVSSLVRSCYRIQYIDLACCTQLTDWTLVELSNLPKLRRIGLVKCNLISDNGILEFVRRRSDQDCLERVHLSYCANLTIGPIYLLLKNCPKLTHLSLTGIVAFLRNDITAFCRDPPPDFSANHRNSFCVFSGHGVNQLRDFLTSALEDNPAHILDNNDMRTIAVERRRRFLEGGLANEVEFEETEVNRIDPNGEIDIDEDDFNGWIGQRGLPNTFFPNDFLTNDARNLAQDEMREHFQTLIRNHHETRIRRQQLQQEQEQQRRAHLEQLQRDQQNQPIQGLAIMPGNNELYSNSLFRTMGNGLGYNEINDTTNIPNNTNTNNDENNETTAAGYSNNIIHNLTSNNVGDIDMSTNER